MSRHARRRDADKAGHYIDEWASREARIQREIDASISPASVLTAAADIQRADDAIARPRAEADGQNQMADAQVAIVADVGGGAREGLGAEHGDVEPGLPPDDLCG